MRMALLLLVLVLAGCGRGGSAPTTAGASPKVETPVPIEWTRVEEGVRFTTDARALAEAQRLADARRQSPAASPTSSPARPRRTAAKLPATLPELRALLADDAWRDRAGEVAAAMLAAGAERDEIATIAARLPAGHARPVRWALARWSARDGFVTLARLRVIADEKPSQEPRETDAPPYAVLDDLLVANDHAAWGDGPAPSFVARLAAISHGLFEPSLVTGDGRVLRFVAGGAVYEIQNPTVGRLRHAANDAVERRGAMERFVLLENGLVVFAPREVLAVAFDSGLLAPPAR